MTNLITQLFDGLIARVNSTSELREQVRIWVGSYQGKVLQLETEAETLHIIIFKQGTMELRKGSYPSPDVIYKASSETLMNLFTGQASFRDLMKRWELIIIGAGHESGPLGQLMLQVLQAK
ncbi:MAG: SCP2 sterol-binding domain-containing protein [Promethearchaeota archaeon]